MQARHSRRFTDRSELAVLRAAALFRENRAAQLSLLHVVAAGLPRSLADQQQRAAEAFLAERLPALQSEAAAASINTIVRTGTLFNTIIGESLSRTADLVVIGWARRRSS